MTIRPLETSSEPSPTTLATEVRPSPCSLLGPDSLLPVNPLLLVPYPASRVPQVPDLALFGRLCGARNDDAFVYPARIPAVWNPCPVVLCGCVTHKQPRLMIRYSMPGFRPSIYLILWCVRQPPAKQPRLLGATSTAASEMEEDVRIFDYVKACNPSMSEVPVLVHPPELHMQGEPMVEGGEGGSDPFCGMGRGDRVCPCSGRGGGDTWVGCRLACRMGRREEW
jgi:hypothetical protein